jgi:branched-chain amino acid aminotransferase
MSTDTTQFSVMVDGTLVTAGDSALVEMDDGLVRGDGIFEGMRFYGRIPRSPEAHLERLAKSGDGAGIPVDRDRLRGEMAQFAEMTLSADCSVRLMLTRSGHVIWREEPVPSFPDGESLLPVGDRVRPILVGVKTLSYAGNMRAQRMAKDAGANDALMYRIDDRVILEGPTTSFGWLEGDTLVFPPLDIGVLDSITRRIAMEAVPSEERERTLDDLKKADGAFLLSSYQQCVPVHTVIGVAEWDIGSAKIREVADAVDAHILTKVEPVGAPTA